MQALRDSCDNYTYFADYEHQPEYVDGQRNYLNMECNRKLKGSFVDIDIINKESVANKGVYDNEELFERYKIRTHNLVDPMSNSDKYWIPALFNVDESGKVEITSDINNLPFYKYGTALYPLLANLFEKMIPSFE